jgi:hypothetical protein
MVELETEVGLVEWRAADVEKIGPVRQIERMETDVAGCVGAGQKGAKKSQFVHRSAVRCH